MGGRYYLTGVQLGILMSDTDEQERMKLLQEIMDDQFIGDFEKEIWEKELAVLEGGRGE